jgi:hypothetical protein
MRIDYLWPIWVEAGALVWLNGALQFHDVSTSKSEQRWINGHGLCGSWDLASGFIGDRNMSQEASVNPDVT